MNYRPEVDGLRAVAVLPVVFFHAGFDAFSGGYVGVDVFFVISGYLITSILLADLRAGTLSLAHFYERRARRILPALFLVMAASSVFAYAWMLPDELENFGQSLVATSMFSNNVLLTLTAGYWDLSSEFKPLLHTWSLGVEEQFYVVFPLLLMGVWAAAKRRLPWAIGALVILSLGAALLWPADPMSAFYGLPTRAWELLLGALLAVQGRKQDGSHDGAFAASGLLLIALSVVLFDRDTPTPSLYTLAPAVGAALVIAYAHPGTAAHRLLSARGAVALGLVSYSAYLWHQPLFAFARIYSKDAPPTWLLLVLCAVTLVLAGLSWRYVETPLRRLRVSRRQVFAAATAGSVGFMAVGAAMHASHGFPGRMGEDGAGVHISYNERAFRFKRDAFERPDAMRVLIVGNSFARDFVNMTLESFPGRPMEIVYRDDLAECGEPHALMKAADVLVFASGVAECPAATIQRAVAAGQRVFYAGPKHFGQNLNWLARLGPGDRANQWNPLPQFVADQEERLRLAVPAAHFVPLLAPIMRSGQVPVTDEHGHIISPDRTHLTRAGAKYLGQRAVAPSLYGKALAHH